MNGNTFLQTPRHTSLLDALVCAATTLLPYPELIDRDALAMALADHGICPAAIRQDLRQANRDPNKPDPKETLRISLEQLKANLQRAHVVYLERERK